MNIKVWDLDEDLEEISNKEFFLDEVVLDDELNGNRKIDTSSLLGYCEEIMIDDLRDHKKYADKHEDKYAISFQVGFGPIKDILTEKFYYESWDIFRKRIDALLKLFNFSSWRIGKGILDRHGEDLLIIELDGLDYPQWSIYFSLSRNMTYRRLLEIAKILESYIQELKTTIDESLKYKKTRKS